MPGSTSRLWKPPPNVGRSEEVRGFGGVVATLLAGFSLTAVAQLVTADRQPPLAEVAVVTFTSASVLLLLSVQSAFLMLRHDASPEERLAWHPEARVDRERLHAERRRQAKDAVVSDAYYGRAWFFFNWGLILFFLGLCCMVVPDEWSVWWIVAAAVAAGGLLVEARWAWQGRGLAWIARPPDPDEIDVDVPPLDERQLPWEAGERHG
jgi:hypothetical protein